MSGEYDFRVVQQTRARALFTNWLLGVLLAFSVAASVAPQPAQAVVFVVNSVGDDPDDPAQTGDGQCSTGAVVPSGAPECTLRAAIEEANAWSGRDRIEFSDSTIFHPVTNVAAIDVPSNFPLITDAVDIDGTTAPSFVAGEGPRILLRNAGATWGLYLLGGSVDSTVKGLAFQGFSIGINLNGPDGVWIDQCAFGYFSPTLPGVGSVVANEIAIQVANDGTADTFIGKKIVNYEFAGGGNVISGNGVGIVNRGPNTSIVGNLIGTDRTGTRAETIGGVPLGNATYGIELHYAGGVKIGRSILRLVGNPQPPFEFETLYLGSEGNVISGNLGHGIYLSSDNSPLGAAGLSILANKIGTDKSGMMNFANGDAGIYLMDAEVPITIGSLEADPNIISGNSGDGIFLDQGYGFQVEIIGNYVGTGANGWIPIPNDDDGIDFRGSSALFAQANVIGHNRESGIKLTALGNGVGDNSIHGNWIGVSPDATPIGNVGPGVLVSSTNTNSVSLADNWIGANAVGIELEGSRGFVTVVENYIGTDPSETNLGNIGAGIVSTSAYGDMEIGRAGQGNVIGWNGGSGAVIESGIRYPVFVSGNFVGVAPSGQPIPNGEHGFQITQTHPMSLPRVMIGAGLLDSVADFPDLGNRIAHNPGDGVSLDIDAGATFRGNRFFQNGDLAVDLNADGRTANDANDGDLDEGANRLQNYPLLDQPGSSVNPFTGELDLEYRVNSDTTNATYDLTIDFYLAGENDIQPRRFLGSDTYLATDANAQRSVSIAPVTDFPAGLQRIVAIATDAEGHSSEVSDSIVVPEPSICLGLWIGTFALVGRLPHTRNRRSAA